MKIIGHRGAGGLGKENSMQAIAAALKAGVDGVEFDIHATRDGRLVLHHDGHGSRTVSLPRPIKDTDSKELEGMLPTFHEAARLVLGHKGQELILDAKGSKWAHELARDIELLRSDGFELKRLYVASFWLRELRRFTKLQPEVTTIALFNIRRMPFWVFWYIARRSLKSPIIGINHSRVVGNLIKYCHGRGVQVYYYTVNNPVDAARYKNRGLDYLATDRPDIMQELRTKQPSLSP